MTPLPGGTFHAGSAPFGFFPGVPGYPVSTPYDEAALHREQHSWRTGVFTGMILATGLAMLSNLAYGKKKWWSFR